MACRTGPHRMRGARLDGCSMLLALGILWFCVATALGPVVSTVLVLGLVALPWLAHLIPESRQPPQLPAKHVERCICAECNRRRADAQAAAWAETPRRNAATVADTPSDPAP